MSRARKSVKGCINRDRGYSERGSKPTTPFYRPYVTNTQPNVDRRIITDLTDRLQSTKYIPKPTNLR